MKANARPSKESAMPQLRCSHFYSDCAHVMSGENEEEVMKAAAEHRHTGHGENPDAWTDEEIGDMRLKIED